MNEQPVPGSTERTRIRRFSEKSVTDRAVLHAILDAGSVAHVAVTDDEGQPYVIPVAYARHGETVVFHGSTGARLFRRLAQGTPTCLTVTLLDGIVLARTAFESSMNYRSVMVLGTATELVGDEKWVALDAITDQLLPGRRESLRPMIKKEVAATLVLSLNLDEVSVKVSAGGPDEPDEDITWPVWAGHIPLVTTFGEPIPADNLDPAYAEVPEHVKSWKVYG